MTSQKMFITNSPALPARCVVCYSDAKSNQSFIDFGMQLDFYGAILICDLCMVNAAELVGFIPVAKFLETQQENRKLASSLFTANAKVKILESFVASYLSDPEFSFDAMLSANPDLSLFEGLTDSDDAGSDVRETDESGLTESSTV